jgi:hypothetical protein
MGCRSHPDVIVAAITSHLPAEPARDEYLLSPAEQQSCGLPKPSLIKLGKVVTVDRRLIRKRLGRLPSRNLRRVLAGGQGDLPQPAGGHHDSRIEAVGRKQKKPSTRVEEGTATAFTIPRCSSSGRAFFRLGMSGLLKEQVVAPVPHIYGG